MKNILMFSAGVTELNHKCNTSDFEYYGRQKNHMESRNSLGHNFSRPRT